MLLTVIIVEGVIVSHTEVWVEYRLWLVGFVVFNDLLSYIYYQVIYLSHEEIVLVLSDGIE